MIWRYWIGPTGLKRCNGTGSENPRAQRLPSTSEIVRRRLPVFTTRPDTLFGATYCVLAPEHRLVSEITHPDAASEVNAYVKASANKSDLQRTDLATEKTGVFTGAYAIHPCNEQPVPIWVADYVLMTYGTGAIMAVPGHDERDHEFASTFGIPIVEVIKGGERPIEEAPFEGDGVCVKFGFPQRFAGR